MNIERINLNLLISFKILYEEKSVTRAANRLAVTQAAMSNTLRLLRNLFDDPLFIRESKGIKPTKKSDDLFSPVCRALESIENVFINEPFIPEEANQCFTLALSDHGELMFLPLLVAHLRQKAPRVRLKVIRYNSTHQEDFFLSKQVDCAIAIDPYHSQLLKRETLFGETGICVAHKGADDRELQLNLKQYMAAEHIAIAYSEKSHETFIDKALASQQINRQVLLTVSHIMTALSVINQSDMIGTFPEKLSRFLATQFNLALIKPPFKLPQCELEMIWPLRVDNDPANQWFREQIRQLNLMIG